MGGSSSAKKAAKAQAAAAREATAESRRQFDLTQEQFKPFREAGVKALGSEMALIGLKGKEAEQAALDAQIESPSQKFLRERAERSLLQNQAAIGGLGGGNVRQALQEQAIGFASQNINNRIAQLAALRSGGQAATQSLGALGTQQSAQIQQNIANRGAAEAAAIQSAGSGMSALGTLAGTGIGAALGGIGGAQAGAAIGGSLGSLLG